MSASPARMPAAPGAVRPVETVYRPRRATALAQTVLFQRRGPRDPTMTSDHGVIWRASRTPEGIASLALRQSSDGAIQGAAWGPGAEWAITQLPALCGADDDDTDFDDARHPLVRCARHRHPGLRLSRTDTVFDVLASAVIEQKVTGLQAFGAWRRLVTSHGDPAPGPTPRPMWAPPTIERWRRIPSWSWHRAGLEPPQARTIVAAAARGDAIARAAAAASDRGDAVLRAHPGIGVWTSAEIRIRAFGDADAVSVGDYHLAHEIGYAFTGCRTDDAGMLELLAPWAGQRQRVIRLLAATAPREPRRGPRLAPEDHRSR